uniref:Uncharacterized protein n=1 Tax=Arundo donax TaxID=35708 RepID=A0A0A8YDF1_ARUDO
MESLVITSQLQPHKPTAPSRPHLTPPYPLRFSSPLGRRVTVRMR